MNNFLLAHILKASLYRVQKVGNVAIMSVFYRWHVILASVEWLAIQVSSFDDTVNSTVVSGDNLQFLDDENDDANATQNDNEGEDDDDGEREAKWRTERLEREKFLEEHQVVSSILLYLTL